ncbi:hypothetical protein IKR55_04895 [bacterium]|nr:hypothetical protein [bacterium]
MFKDIKNQIKELAKNAVLVAETELGTGKGQEKKKMAVNYVVSNLPFSNLVKNIIAIILSGFIDDVIEISVKLMNNSLSGEQGE